MFNQKEIELAARLYVYARRMFGKKIEDVILWRHERGLSFALRGNGWNIAKILSSFPRRQYRMHEIELIAAASLGVKQKIDSRGFPSPQFTSGSLDMSTGEYFEMLDSISVEFLDFDPSRLLSVTCLPYPGVPMTKQGKTLPYFSVAKKRMIEPSATPRWVIDNTRYTDFSMNEQKPSGKSVDLCLIARTAEAPPHVARRFGYAIRKHTPLLFAHSVNEALFTKEAREGLERCGGLIFPSLSVGVVPASNFGTISMIFDPRTVIHSLAPYRKRRSSPPDFMLYETDTWTPGTSELLGSYAKETFDELSGNADFSSYYRKEGVLRSIGPWGLSNDAGTRTIHSVSEMFRVAQRRAKAWPRGLSEEQFHARVQQYAGSKEQYGYLEAKALCTVPIGWLSAVAAPRSLLRRTVAHLRSLGFEGSAIEVPLSAEEDRALDPQFIVHNEATDQLRFEYAWRVSDAVYRQTSGMILR